MEKWPVHWPAENARSRICERAVVRPLVHPEIASREIAPLESPLFPRSARSEMLRLERGSRGQAARNFQITKLLDNGLLQVTPLTGEVIMRSRGANERCGISDVTASFSIRQRCGARCHLIFIKTREATCLPPSLLSSRVKSRGSSRISEKSRRWKSHRYVIQSF